jgi:MFS family permease
MLILLVPDLRPRRRRQAAKAQATVPRPTPVDRPRVSVRLLFTPDLLRLTIVTALLGLMSIGEVYVFLELQDRDNLARTYYSLLLVGMNLAYLILALPLGRLADRIGRWPVFVAGYVALLLAYLGAGGPMSGTAITCVCLALLGAFYAATDGMLAAMAGQSTAAPVRASAIASAQTVLAAASFCSSLIFASLWTAIGRSHALLVMAVALGVVIPVALVLLRQTGSANRAPAPEPAETT